MVTDRYGRRVRDEGCKHEKEKCVPRVIYNMYIALCRYADCEDSLMHPLDGVGLVATSAQLANVLSSTFYYCKVLHPRSELLPRLEHRPEESSPI